MSQIAAPKGPFERMARRGRDLATQTALEASFHAASEAAGVPLEAVRVAPSAHAVRHGKPDAVRQAQARQHAIYVAATVFGCSQNQLARKIGTTRQRVSALVDRVEEQREDSTVDRALDEIELSLMGGV